MCSKPMVVVVVVAEHDVVVVTSAAWRGVARCGDVRGARLHPRRVYITRAQVYRK